MQDETQPLEPKTNARTVLLGIAVAVVLLALIGWYFIREQRALPNASTTATSTATTTMTVGGVTFVLPPGSDASITVEKTPATHAKGPSLDRPVVFPTDFPADAEALWRARFAALKSDIAKNPYSYDDWIEAGIDWKMLGDYEGTRLAWEYAATLTPTDPVAFSNLGFLYGYYLHDAAKAVQDFDMAIRLDPKTSQWYQMEFEYYRDVAKDMAKARLVAEAGSKATGETAFFDQLIATLAQH